MFDTVGQERGLGGAVVAALLGLVIGAAVPIAVSGPSLAALLDGPPAPSSCTTEADLEARVAELEERLRDSSAS